MRIVFLSNFYNHHQSGVSRKLYELTKGQYRFVATEKMPEERKQLGYADISDTFVLQYGEDPHRDREIQKFIDDADAVIIGSAPEHLIKNRKKSKKLIIRYSERPLKNGFQWLKYPLRYFSWHLKNPRCVPIYMLCASAYTASDYAKFGLFKNKSLKWGYFPRFIKYEDATKAIAQKNTSEILWCGRFLDWKHPDDAIAVAVRLKNEGYDFHLTIVGAGEMETPLKTMVVQHNLTNDVTFVGAISSDHVRGYMERAGIYLMTSDRKEGWGAVINEAMNSGCAVIASPEAGAVPYLIQHNVNGMIYDACNVEKLYKTTAFLLDHPEEQKRLGEAAYETIACVWNAEESACRLFQIIERLCKGSNEFFSEGPCSEA